MSLYLKTIKVPLNFYKSAVSLKTTALLHRKKDEDETKGTKLQEEKRRDNNETKAKQEEKIATMKTEKIDKRMKDQKYTNKKEKKRNKRINKYKKYEQNKNIYIKMGDKRRKIRVITI